MKPAELRDTLERLGMGQTQLANELGVSARAVRYWLNGRNPVPKWLISWLEMYERLNPPSPSQ